MWWALRTVNEKRTLKYLYKTVASRRRMINSVNKIASEMTVTSLWNRAMTVLETTWMEWLSAIVQKIIPLTREPSNCQNTILWMEVTMTNKVKAKTWQVVVRQVKLVQDFVQTQLVN